MTETLSAALADFQADPPVLVKNKAGHQSRYADLVQVNHEVLSKLNKLGVIYVCRPNQLDDGKFVLDYRLIHVASGEEITGRYPLKLSDNPQQMGSAITYARRYVLLSLTGVAAEDEDDDGRAAGGARGTAQRANTPATRQAAAGKPAGRTAQRGQHAAPPLPSDGPQPYTPAQRAKLMASFGQLGIDDRSERLDICMRIVGHNLTSANDLTKKEAAAVLDKLDEASKRDNPLLYLAEITDADPAGDPAVDPAETS